MNLQLMGTIHTLPLWLLVFSLFLPRIALLVYWLENDVTPLHLSGWLPIFVAVVLPRALILYLIYTDQGLSVWFAVHLVVAIGVWAGSGRATSRRRQQ
jgi:hypothetical protein